MNDDWTPQLAEDLAERAGIALGERLWCVIGAIRERLARGGSVPSLEEIGAQCGVSPAEMKTLFSGHAEDVLARIAGAPEIERR